VSPRQSAGTGPDIEIVGVAKYSKTALSPKSLRRIFMCRSFRTKLPFAFSTFAARFRRLAACTKSKRRCSFDFFPAFVAAGLPAAGKLYARHLAFGFSQRATEVKFNGWRPKGTPLQKAQRSVRRRLLLEVQLFADAIGFA
jgi:hypothetical protein